MRFARWISVAALSLTLVLGPVATAEAQSYEPEELRFLELINAYRQENGLEPLLLSAPLSVASERHSEDMGTYGFFSHTTEASSYYPVGSGPTERIAREGYDYNTYTAENLAYGQATAEEVFEAWRTSPSHNVNMLGDYKVIGIGLAWGNGTPYWTTEFGAYVDSSASGGSTGTPPDAGAGSTTPDTETVRDTVAPRGAGTIDSQAGRRDAADSQYTAADQYDGEAGSRTPPEEPSAKTTLQAATDQYDEETTPGDTGEQRVARTEITQPVSGEPPEDEAAEAASTEAASTEVAPESAPGSAGELPSEKISMLPDTGGFPLTALPGGAALLLVGGWLARDVFRAK